MQVRFWCGPLRPMCGTHKRTHAHTHVRTYPNGAARNALMPWYIANLHHGGSRTVILSLARLAVPTPPSYHKNASALASKLAKRPSEHHPVFSERAESVKVLQKMNTKVNFTIGIRKHSSRNAVFYYIKPHLARAIFPILQHTLVYRYTGTPTPRDTDTRVHQNVGTTVHWNTEALVHECKYTGIPIHWSTGTEAHRYTNIPVHKYTHSLVHRYYYYYYYYYYY